MARYQAKPKEDGRGPYRWAHVVRTPKGLVLGTIYRQLGDDLSHDETATLRSLCDRHGFDLRRASPRAKISNHRNAQKGDRP